MKKHEKLTMTSNKPYLIRAFHEWIMDNNMIPHIVVNASLKNVKVPQQYIEDGKIVLNISYTAAQHLQISSESITFSARFGGHLTNIYIPIEAVLAIYARETGTGMVFDITDADMTATSVSSDDDTGDSTTSPPAIDTPKKAGKPTLTIVK